MVILDTSVLIDSLRQSKSHFSILKQFIDLYPKDELSISILTIQELYAGKSSNNLINERLFLAVIDPLEILPYTDATAKLAGELTRDSGEHLGFPDAAIAATAILNKAKLFTLNKKDFQGIKKLMLI